MFDVITVGSSTRDVFLKSEYTIITDPRFETGKAECFALGTKLEVDEIAFTSGGGGTNAAVTFARQGYKTACIGVVGPDQVGDNILSELQGEGIDVSLFQRHETGYTAYSAILVHSTGARTILSYKGEGQNFNVDLISADQLDTKWLYIDSLGGHIDILEKLVDHAGTKDIKVAFNPGGKILDLGKEALMPFISKIDVYITNKEEGAKLLGIDSGDFEAVARGLKEIVPGIVSVSNGKEGVTVIDAESKKYTAGIPDSQVIERTGAGDSFGSGFVSEYMKSGDIVKAIQFGTANASSVVTKFGGKEGILKKGDMGPWPLVDVSVS